MAGKGCGRAFSRFTLAMLGGTVALTAGLAVVAPVAPATSPPRTVIHSMATVSLWGDDRRTIRPEGQAANADPSLTLSELTDAYGMRDLQPVAFKDLEHGVPPVFTQNIPWGLGRLRDTTLRQTLFLYALAPLVIHENQRLLNERRKLWALHVRKARSMHIDPLDRLWLAAMARRYQVEEGDDQALFQRLDRVPPAWVLAMAGIHGQWGHHVPLLPVDTDGRAPLRRLVRDYLEQVNSDPRFEAFRKIRAEARQKGQPPPDQRLIAALKHATENVHGIDRIIAMHGLDVVNGMNLASDSAF